MADRLKPQNKEIVDKILGLVSTGIKLDIEDGLKGKPRSLDDVERAQSEITSIMQKKVNSGELVLSPEGDEYV